MKKVGDTLQLSASAQQHASSAILVDKTKPFPTPLGVRGVWVSAEARRQRIASSLIDTAIRYASRLSILVHGTLGILVGPHSPHTGSNTSFWKCMAVTSFRTSFPCPIITLDKSPDKRLGQECLWKQLREYYLHGRGVETLSQSQFVVCICRVFSHEGRSVLKQNVAFSQPTADGLSLARVYTGKADFLAYLDSASAGVERDLI